jgi:hypothetical protein
MMKAAAVPANATGRDLPTQRRQPPLHTHRAGAPIEATSVATSAAESVLPMTA